MPKDWLISAPGLDFIGNHEDFYKATSEIAFLAYSTAVFNDVYTQNCWNYSCVDRKPCPAGQCGDYGTTKAELSADVVWAANSLQVVATSTVDKYGP